MTHAEPPCIAVCGAGYWGKNLVRNFHALGALHTVCDRDPEILRRTAEAYPDVHLTNSLQAILDDGEIAGVVLATPAATHFELGLAILGAGKDLYVEKPLCLRAAEGQKLVDAARKGGRVLMVGHILDYHPAVEKLLELVNGGELGKIQYVYSNRLNLGKIRREENILWSFAPHDISLISAIVGEEPTEVSAGGGSYLQPHVADVTVTQLSFSGGVRAHIFVSWLHPVKEQRLVVVGSKAMAVFDDRQPIDGKLVVYDHRVDWIDHEPVAKAAEGRAIELEGREPMRAECADFLARIADRGRPRSDGENGLRVLRVLEAAQRSLETGGGLVAVGQPAPDPGYYVHPTAIVEDGAKIGKGTRIWHFCHVMPGCEIGERCNFGQNVFIAKGAKVGTNCKVQNNVSLYAGVTLEDDVFCGPSMVFTNVSIPRSHHPRQDVYEETRICRGATLGANSTIVCGHTVGEFAFVGAGAVVSRDVPPFALVLGNPARVRGWRCICGEPILFASVLDGEETGVACTECGRSYDRTGTTVRVVG